MTAVCDPVFCRTAVQVFSVCLVLVRAPEAVQIE
jgi:hypothetical protein